MDIPNSFLLDPKVKTVKTAIEYSTNNDFIIFSTASIKLRRK